MPESEVDQGPGLGVQRQRDPDQNGSEFAWGGGPLPWSDRRDTYKKMMIKKCLDLEF